MDWVAGAAGLGLYGVFEVHLFGFGMSLGICRDFFCLGVPKNIGAERVKLHVTLHSSSKVLNGVDCMNSGVGFLTCSRHSLTCRKCKHPCIAKYRRPLKTEGFWFPGPALPSTSKVRLPVHPWPPGMHQEMTGEHDSHPVR